MAASKLIPQEKGENTPLVLLQQLPDTGLWFELAEEREARLYLRAHCGWTWSQWKSMFSPFSQLTRFTAFLQHFQGEKNYKLPRNTCWPGLNKGQKDCDCLSAAIKAPNPTPNWKSDGLWREKSSLQQQSKKTTSSSISPWEVFL